MPNKTSAFAARLRLATAPLALAAAFGGQALVAAAGAVDVTTARTTPINTSTAESGAAGDVTITSAGSIEVTSGTAVTVDSDDDVSNAGQIRINDADDAVGVRVTPGRTGSVSNTGSIAITETHTPADSDSDGDVDQPVAVGARRVGILIEGGSGFTGSVTQGSSGSITVEGNDSAGVRALAAIDGDVTLDGATTVTGARSVGVDLRGVTGDVNLEGNVSAVGEGARAVALNGDIVGGVNVDGTISASAFRELSRRFTSDQRALLDADDLLSSGPVMAIGGNVAQGVLVDAGGSVLSYGDAVALLVSAGVDPDRVTSVILNRVVETTADGDVVRDYAIVNRGAIQAFGLNDGFSSTAVRIEGAGALTAALEGGFSNESRIDASAALGDATGVQIASGGIVPTLANSGGISVTTLSDGDETSRAIWAQAGGELAALINDGSITAILTGEDGDAFAVIDQSGTLLLVENAGSIEARIALTDTTATAAGQLVAIDLSSATNAAVVRQLRRDADDTAPSITGDVRFGSGGDTLDLQAGSVTGDVAFGAGADTFMLSGGSTFAGVITDSDGDLVLDVQDGSFNYNSTDALNITSARFGAASSTAFRIAGSGADLSTGSLVATGAIEIVDGAVITPVFTDTRTDSFDVVLMSADGGIVITGADTLTNALAGDQPFLYETALETITTGSGEDLVLAVRRRTADELGMNANQSAAFLPALTAVGDDGEVALALAALSSQDEFFEAYNQVLPDFTGAQLQFARANLDGGIGAVANRLDVVRGGREAAGGVWIQEFATFADRSGTVTAPGYRGRGVGLAVGADRRVGPFYAVGVNLVGAASQYNDHTTFDQPLSAVTAHVGGYAAAKAGPLLLDVYGGVGADFFDSERVVRIGSVQRTSDAEWSAYHLAASGRAAMERTLGWFYVRPEVAVDFLSLREEGYQETGGGALNLDVDERTADLVTSTASLTFGGRFNRDGRTWWSPRLRVGYRNSLSGDTPLTTANFIGGADVFTLRADELPDNGSLVGFSFAAGGEYSSFAFDYDADVRDGFQQHIARVAFRFLF